MTHPVTTAQLATAPKAPAKRKTKAEPETRISAIKGMDKDMSCRGHKFETGQTYSVTGPIKACTNGFHSCPVDADISPLAVFEYYAPGVSRYFEVEAHGKAHRDGTKIASASVTIGVEVGVGVMVDRFIKWVTARAKPTGEVTNSGTHGAASNGGDYGAASNSGDSGAAFSHAFNSKVMCEGDGQALYCTEFADDGSIKSVACGITGRDGIEAGVWYFAKDGRLAPA